MMNGCICLCLSKQNRGRAFRARSYSYTTYRRSFRQGHHHTHRRRTTRHQYSGALSKNNVYVSYVLIIVPECSSSIITNHRTHNMKIILGTFYEPSCNPPPSLWHQYHARTSCFAQDLPVPAVKPTYACTARNTENKNKK